MLAVAEGGGAVEYDRKELQQQKETTPNLSLSIASLVVCTIVLISISASNLRDLNNIRKTQVLGTLAPPAGALMGRNAFDGSEWQAKETSNSVSVVFGILEPGARGDLPYWREVARLARASGSTAEFVGLCVRTSSCDSPIERESDITVLNLMDPLQTYALDLGARKFAVHFRLQTSPRN
jgi:hypothetical protein